MPTSLNEIQKDLQQGYDGLADQYTQALNITATLPVAFDTGTHADGELQQLADIMAKVGAIERCMTPLKRQWEAAGKPITSELKSTISRVRGMLETLITSVSSAEEHAQDARGKLSPRLQAETISHRMRAAYAANSQK